MSWIRSRASRVRRFGRVVVGLVLGSVALASAVAFWANTLGYLGLGVLAALVLVAFIGILAVPESAWLKVAGVDTFAEELGRLHAEGAVLRNHMPVLPDSATAELDQLQAAINVWAQRVVDILQAKAPRWIGVFGSKPATGMRAVLSDHVRVSNMQHFMDDRLQRLSEIMVALERST